MTEIDQRTSDNPEAAMVHQPDAGQLRYTDELLQQLAIAKISRENAAKQEAPHFDSDAHRAFMRGLG